MISQLLKFVVLFKMGKRRSNSYQKMSEKQLPYFFNYFSPPFLFLTVKRLRYVCVPTGGGCPAASVCPHPDRTGQVAERLAGGRGASPTPSFPRPHAGFW